MKKFYAILLFVCLAVGKAGAFEWTDDNGVTWTFSQSNYTINGESQKLWRIEGAKNYGENVTVPQTVYNGTDACTIEAITGPYFPNASNVTLPATIKYIGKYVFSGYDDRGLMYAGTVKINAATPPAFDSYYGMKAIIGSGVTVLVPAASLSAYHKAEGWKDMDVRIISQSVKTSYDINATARSTSSGIHASVGEENLGNVMSLTVSGSINSYDILVIRNKMHNLHHLDLTNARIVANSYKYYENYNTTDNDLGPYTFTGMIKIITVKLPKTITSISERAFNNCDGLQTVEFQDALKSVGNNAFSSCENLKQAQFKVGLEKIGNQAFENCFALSSITFPANGLLKTIGQYAFYGCSSLTSVTLPANGSMEEIGKNAFESCRKLTTVALPINGSLMTIGSYAFYRCSSLTSVAFPTNGSLKTINGAAFYGCSSLPSIEIPEGITVLYGSTFYGCSKLTNVSLPSTLITISSECFRACSSMPAITLPIKLKYIYDNAFFNCTSLAEIHLPSTIRSIGKSAFSGCTSLKDYYVYTIEPTNIEESTFSNWTTATLHIPRHAYDNYYWNTQWSKFDKLVQDNSYQYKYFYLTQDYVFNDEVGTMSSTPDVQLDGGSGLVVETTNTVNLNEIHMSDNGTTAASIIANGNLTAEKVFIELTVQKNKWYFISLPFRVKAENVQAPGQYVIRYYDGKERATNGSGGWKNYTETYLQPKQGYILQCNADGTVIMTAENADLDFSGGDRQDALNSYVAENTQNASWNFLGNPHSSYYDIDDTGYEAPITVWNGSSYVAVRAGDDQYHLGPLQGFFVQKPEDKNHVNFPASGRHTLNQWADRVAEKQATSRSRAESRSLRKLVNLTIGNGENVDDQTRVVFNPQKSKDYEMDCDAAKFMSDQPVAQLYSLDQETQYAINERPEGEVNLGYVAAEEGMLTISAERMDCPVWLRDNEKGITHDLSVGGYTFNSAAGKNDSRFTLLLSGEKTAIEKTEMKSVVEGTIYTLGGIQLPEGCRQAGTYIVKKGNKATKVIKK